MDKIVSLSRRRGFVFPSSEIYGGMGSTFDYGHYGVLMKNNIRARWFEAMVRNRDDIVAIDSAVILHPRVWEASGHVGGFSDPLIDCRTCKLRFRADKLEDSNCGRKPSKRPGETPECDLTEPRQFNLMFETTVGALQEEGSRAYLRPETAQGIFINFKNVLQIARRKPPFGIAQIGKSFRNEITPGNFLFRVREFEQMEMEFFVPPDEADKWYRYWIDERLNWYRRYGLRDSKLRVREHGPEERSHYSQGTSDIEYDYPIGWGELEGIANRGDFDLTQHTEHSTTKLEYVGQDGERYVPYVIEPAVSIERIMRRHARRRVRRGGRRRPRANRPPPAPADRAGHGRRPAAHRQERRDGRKGARPLRGAPPAPQRRVRRRWRDRAPLPPPGRDRHTVGVHRRRTDARGRHGDGPRPRFTRARAAADRRRAATGSRPRSSATGSRRRRARRCAACAAGSPRSIRTRR